MYNGYMTNYIYLADILVWIIFLLIYAARPARSTLSHYELNRLIKSGDAHAKSLGRRNKLLPGALLIKRWLEIILALMIVWLSVKLNGWLLGLIISGLAIVLADLLSRWQPIERFSKRRWAKIEPRILVLIHNHLGWLVKIGPKEQTEDRAIHSKQELIHIISSSQAFDAELKTRLLASLDFGDIKVKDIMTPRSEIISVNQNDTLGPVVLDSLHKTGHSRFPVIEENMDSVIGILQLNKLVGDMRKTHTAKKAMEPNVSYIHESETLTSALVTFLHTGQHLLIVVNKSKKTTGIITLQALLEKLVGHGLEGQFDEHGNLEAIAEAGSK